ncbi:MAG: RNA polymerase sigma factor [Prosthecobacter sp.]
MILGCDPAAAHTAPQIDLACDRLYRRHQATLVAFACRRGCDEHEAWDVVQELFLRTFRRGMLMTLSSWTDEAQRAWLLRALRWLISNHLRDRMRMKRGCSHAHESLEHLLEEGHDIPGHTSPATEHDRRWAVSVLDRGMARLRTDMKPAAWACFESSLWGGNELPSTPAMRVASHRARRRLRELIRCESSESALYLAASGRN